MHPGIRLAILSAAIVVPLHTQADPWKDESGHGRPGHKVEEKYDLRTGEYKYEEKGPGYKYEYKGRGGPPPWAGAYGRRHRGPDRARGDAVYVPPFGIEAGRCNREVLGAALGGAAGGYLGSRVGSGDGQLAATAAGTVAGILVGGEIGRSMDRLDQNCVGQVLEHAPDGREIIWSERAGAPEYKVAPIETYRQQDGAYCREYQTTAVIAGTQRRTYGTACRQPDGSWKLVS